MASNVTIGQIFGTKSAGWNSLHRWIFSSMLMPNEDNHTGWFHKHGLVQQTDENEDSQAAIHMIKALAGEQRGKKVTLYLEGYLSAPPEFADLDGYSPAAGATQRTIGQSDFEFEVFEVFGPDLRVPTQTQEANVATGIVGNYARKQAAWWLDMFEEGLLIYLSGFRGKSQAYKVFSRQDQNGNNIAQVDPAAFTAEMKRMHATNEIWRPNRAFATPDAAFVPNNAINAAGFTADASKKLTIAKLSSLLRWTQNRIQGIDEWELNPARIKVMQNERNGEPMPSSKEAWAIVIAPEVAEDMRAASGTGSWYEYQLAAAASVGYQGAIQSGVPGRLSGFDLLINPKLSKYFGGASSNIPVARCLMLGAQSAAYGFQGEFVPERYRPRDNEMASMIGNYGLPMTQWIGSDNYGRNHALQSCAVMGFSVIGFKGPNSGVFLDRGRVTIDVPFGKAGDQLAV